MDFEPSKQLVVAHEYRQWVLELTHDSPFSGHQGCKKTLQRDVKRDVKYFYCPKMKRPVRNFVSSCDICQRGKHREYKLGDSVLVLNPLRPNKLEL